MWLVPKGKTLHSRVASTRKWGRRCFTDKHLVPSGKTVAPMCIILKTYRSLVISPASHHLPELLPPRDRETSTTNEWSRYTCTNSRASTHRLVPSTFGEDGKTSCDLVHRVWSKWVRLARARSRVTPDRPPKEGCLSV